MILKKIITMMLLTFFFYGGNAEASDFNNKKLLILCEHFSSDTKSCIKDVEKLSKMNKGNSIINYCYSNYQQLDSFGNCLKYEYNPLVFLKYQKKRPVSSLKNINIKKEISNRCPNDRISPEKCFEENYVMFEKSKNTKYWIENYCVTHNENLKDINDCVSRIKREATSENNLINLISHLISSFDKFKEMYQTNRHVIFEKVYKSCSEKYSGTNIYNCVDAKLNKSKKEFLQTSFNSLICSSEKTIENFENCISKK